MAKSEIAQVAVAPVAVAKAPRKPQRKLTDRYKEQLAIAAFRGKVTVDDIQDLQSHLSKIAELIA